MPIFAMTYPASLLVTPTGGLQCVPFHDEGPRRALAIFTDRQLAELFCRLKTGAGEYKQVVIPDEQALIDSLRHYERQLGRADVIHVALDPTPGQRLSAMLLQDFIEDLEGRPPSKSTGAWYIARNPSEAGRTHTPSGGVRGPAKALCRLS